MKKYLCSIIVFISTLSFAQVLNYFPMQKNNYWSFVTTVQDTQIIHIADTMTYRNKLYYIFDNYRIAQSLLRMDSNKVYAAVDTSEYMIYNFSAKIDDTWSAPETNDPLTFGIVTLQSKTDTVHTPFGTFDYCYRFNHFFGADYEYNEWFAPNVGLVKRDYIFFYFTQWNLVDYFILTSVKHNQSLNEDDYILFSNYPNPFNPTTKIRFSIPSVEVQRSQFIQLKVFDVLGREVAVLVNEPKPPGNYEVVFEGTGLSSGIYFYQLQSGAYFETKKMLLMK